MSGEGDNGRFGLVLTVQTVRRSAWAVIGLAGTAVGLYKSFCWEREHFQRNAKEITNMRQPLAMETVRLYSEAHEKKWNIPHPELTPKPERVLKIKPARPSVWKVSDGNRRWRFAYDDEYEYANSEGDEEP
mmetsp:Transcript_3660/g.11792  ORF Transcript_3660/g.11792 Transcript_3660/m.11792 type:complete len:131 (+) Transcript_3660:216-608(+)